MNLPLIGRITLGGVIVGMLLGVIFAPQVRQIPLIDKLPTF